MCGCVLRKFWHRLSQNSLLDWLKRRSVVSNWWIKLCSCYKPFILNSLLFLCSLSIVEIGRLFYEKRCCLLLRVLTHRSLAHLAIVPCLIKLLSWRCTPLINIYFLSWSTICIKMIFLNLFLFLSELRPNLTLLLL